LNSIGSRIEGSSFSGLLTRVEIAHPHRLSRERPQQIAGIGFIAQPPELAARREDQRHPIVDFGD
jgi:hypothetical protein